MEADAFKPVVLAPTYNNARTLAAIVDSIVAMGHPLIVVNDGSTDGTSAILKSQIHAIVLTHPRNRGKAAALQTGFAAATERGFTHALTIDTDGQHDPAEIPRLLSHSREKQGALVLGLRDDSAPGYPARSRLGRRVSNLFIRMESGVSVGDSQCGMRVYPLKLAATVKCSASRYGFETEIVTRAAWAGFEIVEVPVTCRYLELGERVSHLHPWIDTFRAFGMHFRLLLRALSPWPAQHDANATPIWHWRRFFHWLNPTEAWRQARRDRVSREAFAAGLAMGAFVGNLPAYGLHAVIGLYVARRLHLQPVPVVVGSHISTPPLGPLLNAAAIVFGHLVLHGSLPTRAEFDIRARGFLHVLRTMLFEWMIGWPVVGLLCAVIVFMISNRLLKLAAAKDAQAVDTPGSQAAHPAESAPGHVA